MKTNKTITVFLADGEPTGTKIVELRNWVGRSYIIPRNKLQNVILDPLNQQDLTLPSVYFLLGQNEESIDALYIGEAENFLERINQHNNKDFWNYAICFFSTDGNLNKAHIKYLESKLTIQVNEAKRVVIINGNNPPCPRLSRSDIAIMEEFLQNIKLVLSTLGFTFLEPLYQDQETPEDLYYCKGKYTEATGVLTNEGFVVRKGSVISPYRIIRQSVPYATMLKDLEKESNLEKISENTYRLKADKLFTSPSYAASFALGRAANGWQEWKNNLGKTLDEVQRKE